MTLGSFGPAPSRKLMPHIKIITSSFVWLANSPSDWTETANTWLVSLCRNGGKNKWRFNYFSFQNRLDLSILCHRRSRCFISSDFTAFFHWTWPGWDHWQAADCAPVRSKYIWWYFVSEMTQNVSRCWRDPLSVPWACIRRGLNFKGALIVWSVCVFPLNWRWKTIMWPKMSQKGLPQISAGTLHRV